MLAPLAVLCLAWCGAEKNRENADKAVPGAEEPGYPGQVSGRYVICDTKERRDRQ